MLASQVERSASVLVVPVKVLKLPTAVQTPGDEHDAPFRLGSVPTGFGVDSNDQLVPSHCSANVCCWPLKSWKKPTARQLLDEVHDTAFRSLSVALGLAGR